VDRKVCDGDAEGGSRNRCLVLVDEPKQLDAEASRSEKADRRLEIAGTIQRHDRDTQPVQFDAKQAGNRMHDDSVRNALDENDALGGQGFERRLDPPVLATLGVVGVRRCRELPSTAGCQGHRLIRREPSEDRWRVGRDQSLARCRR